MNKEKRDISLCAECSEPVGSNGRHFCLDCRRCYLRARRWLGIHSYDSLNTATNRRYEAKRIAMDSKGGKCKRCGFKAERPEQYAALHFHHPDRNRWWKQPGFGNRNPETIAAELAQCELLCANCHTIEHHKDKTISPGRPRKPLDEKTKAFIIKLSAKNGVPIPDNIEM